MLSGEHALGTTPIQPMPGRRGRLIEQERVVLAGYATRVLRAEGRGPTVLMIHGFGDSADTWSRVLGRLAHEGQAAVALDLPGFARADVLRPEPVLPQLVAFTRAAVARYATRGRGTVLVGNSLGGAAALLAAQGAGPPLRAVVPIAPAGFDMARWIYRLQTFTTLETMLRFPFVPLAAMHSVVARIFRELAIHNQDTVDAHVVDSFVRHYEDRRTTVRYLQTAHRLRPELSEPFVLSDVRVPVKIIWGQHDRMLSVSGAELAQAAVPHATVEILPDCGHCPQIEDPGRTTEILLETIDAL